MKVYKEEDYLMLSGIQHYMFCKRQWALIHVEQQWAENYLTVDGNIMHERAHDGSSFEKRRDTIISRGMPIASPYMGVSGICDIVVFEADEQGISIHGRDEMYKVYPVEYKRGKEKQNNVDSVQVVAQAMCLEEMFGCTIDTGYIYYGQLRKRVAVPVTQALRTTVEEMFEEMHKLLQRRYTPHVKATKACQACSLKEVCLPKIQGKKSAREYILQMIEVKADEKTT